MNKTLANRLSMAAAILLLFLTAIGNATLMIAASAVVLFFGVMFFGGKMKAKIAVSALIGFTIAAVVSRFLFK